MWPELETELLAARDLHFRSRPARALRRFRRILDGLRAIDKGTLGPEDHARWADAMVRSLMGEAFGVHAVASDLDGALTILDDAARHAARSPKPLRRGLVAVAVGYRGLVLLRSGRSAESLPLFDSALAGAASLPGRTSIPDRDLATLHVNRGAALTDLGRLVPALRDYEAAIVVARRSGNTALAALALHNIGFVRYALGNLPGALSAMNEARAAAPDREDGVLDIGRGAVLFEAGLLADAERVLAAALRRMRGAGRSLDRAEVEYYRARCLLALHRYDEARRSAAFIRRHDVRSGHGPRAAMARVFELEVDVAEVRDAVRAGKQVPSGLARRRARRALAVAAHADGAGKVLGRESGGAARLVAAQWHLVVGDVKEAAQLLAALPRGFAGATLTHRVQYYGTVAELAFATGRRAAGLRAVRSGYGLLTAHRARLGAVESIAAAGTHAVTIQLVDVRAALGTGRAPAVFDAIERGRAMGAGSGRLTPSGDPGVAGLLTQARGLIAQARHLPAGSGERERLTTTARALQEQVREQTWVHAGDADVVRPVTARELRKALADGGEGTVVASLATFGGRVVAVRVDAHGTRLLDLGDPAQVAEQAHRVRADLAVVANAFVPPPLRDAARRSLTRGLDRLDTMLVAPLHAPGPLHLVARHPYVGLPWSALPSRRGLATWARSYVARRRPLPVADDGGARRVLVAAGPQVTEGAAEALAVGAVWPGSLVLLGRDATTEAVRDALATHDVVHLATHGRHDAANPLFASVDLADGPLFAHELDGTRLPGSVVVLSSCEVGASSPRGGGEVLGLTSVLLRLGARAVIASVGPLSDAVAAKLMPRLHAELRAGRSPQAALATVLADEPDPVPLVCFGSVDGLAP
ncbi:CHAT domain-containing protein [Antribacter gilvus]|uniref:CHAT domain-containing protein n=1 Tax=Antribacter gilvus TaxID=2304675 RepID=UPI000F7B288E|nr:CHAT domain-containing tetratricopeptide repeat protein [Antribacter gilvus]